MKIKNLKVRTALTRFVVTFAILGTFAGCSKKIDKKVSSEQNRIGYATTYGQIMSSDENFAILDVGNYKYQHPSLKNGLINFLNSKGVSLGIVISTKAVNESDIYNDLAYVKSLISEKTIDFPVYLNLTGIIENKKLNPEMKKKLTSIFLSKCEENGIYVGIYGTDEILCKAEEQLDGIIESYDALVVQNNDDIKYSGRYSLRQDNNGVIYSEQDLSKVIKEKNLNNDNNFLNDKEYKIKENDSIIDIAYKYDMSAESVLEYNKLKMKGISKDAIIKLPSKQLAVNEVTYKSGSNVEFIRGCNISQWQSNINWDKLKENFSYVIIRSNIGFDADKNYNENINNAIEKEIPVGIFCYNGCNAIDHNLEDFKEYQIKQANTTVSLLRGKDITYPVYLDIEKRDDENKKYWTELMPEEYVISMINIWYDTMSSNGYIPGIYTNGECYKHLKSIYDRINEKGQKTSNERKFVQNWLSIQKWLAGGEQYGSGSLDLNSVEPPSSDRIDEDISMYHVANNVTNAGSSNDSGYLDISYSNFDYQRGKEVTSSDELEIKEFTNYSDIIALAMAAGGVLVVGGVATAIHVHKKTKSKVKSKKLDSQTSC